MRGFWSLIENDKYKIGCTGKTVCLFDKQDNEIAKFRDFPYAYTSAISPRGDIFVVKTTEGRENNPAYLSKATRIIDILFDGEERYDFVNTLRKHLLY